MRIVKITLALSLGMALASAGGIWGSIWAAALFLWALWALSNYPIVKRLLAWSNRAGLVLLWAWGGMAALLAIVLIGTGAEWSRQTIVASVAGAMLIWFLPVLNPVAERFVSRFPLPMQRQYGRIALVAGQAIVVSALAFPFLLAAIEHGESELVESILEYGVLGFVVPAAMLMSLGRKVMAGAEEVRIEDGRSVFLYLRSFVSDGSGETEARGVSRLMEPIVSLTQTSVEQQIHAAVKLAGQFVAIGRPTEALPQLGAARVYPSENEAWHEMIRDLMRHARLVIIRVGSSPGLRWEIETALRELDPPRLLLLLPPLASDRDKTWTDFVNIVGPSLSVPERIGDAIFIAFTEGGAARLFGGDGSLSFMLSRIEAFSAIACVFGIAVGQVRSALEKALDWLEILDQGSVHESPCGGLTRLARDELELHIQECSHPRCAEGRAH